MKAAIVYLVRSTQVDVIDLIRSLISLKKFFLNKYPYPVILLVEPTFKEEWRCQVAQELRDSINFTFADIIFNIKGLESVPRIINLGQQNWPLGYRHMCRFWSGGFLTNHTIAEYDYVWRMDTDAYLTHQVDHDIFQRMCDNKVTYAYSNTTHDVAEVCVGLDDASRTFFNMKGYQYRWEPFKMYTTHVEIMHVPTMKNSDYFEYYKALDKHPYNGFYMRRWGDAPIRYIAFSNLPNLKTMKMDVSYVHGNDGSGRREQIRTST